MGGKVFPIKAQRLCELVFLLNFVYSSAFYYNQYYFSHRIIFINTSLNLVPIAQYTTILTDELTMSARESIGDIQCHLIS